MNIEWRENGIDESCEWVKKINNTILLGNKVVGYIDLFLFSKKDIDKYIYEDYPFYMSEDTKMQENLCYFLYKNMGNKEVIYINELMIDKEYRKRGIGKRVLSLLEQKYKEKIFILFAGEIEEPIKFINDIEYQKNKLTELNIFYNKAGYRNHGQVYYKNINFSKDSWKFYDEYEALYLNSDTKTLSEIEFSKK